MSIQAYAEVDASSVEKQARHQGHANDKEGANRVFAVAVTASKRSTYNACRQWRQALL